MKANLRRIPLLALACIIPLLSSHPLQAAISGYIKIGDIQGESQHIGHEGEIEVQSLSWGIKRDGSDRTSPPTFADLTITKPVDKATPKLIEACAMGTVFAECELSLIRSYSTGKEEIYMRIVLKNTVVTSSSLDVPDPNAGQPLTETLSLNFGEVEMEYFVRSATGGLEGVVNMTYTATP